MKQLFFLGMLALLFNSCSLEQSIVNELEGTWEVTSRTVNGDYLYTVTSETQILSFDKCANVTSGNCTGTHSTFTGPTSPSTTVTPFVYTIDNNGTQLSFEYPNGNVINVTIMEHNEATFRINYTHNVGYIEEVLTKI